jgi:hypothetical protein
MPRRAVITTIGVFEEARVRAAATMEKDRDGEVKAEGGGFVHRHLSGQR